MSVADAVERSVAVHPDGAELTRTDGRIISGNTHLHPSVCIIFGYAGKPGDSGPAPQLDNVANVTVNGYLQPFP